MSKNLNVNLSFTADTTQAKKNILDLQNSLNSITSIGNTKLKLTDDMQIAVNSAKQLQMHLANALNTRTGNFDLNKLNASLKASNTSLATLGNGLLKAGVQGEKAFMNIQRSIATANVQIKQANGFLAQMRSTLMNTLRWQIASSALHSMASAVSSAVQYAEDLDKSLNNIRIVTGQNAEQMAKFAKEANKAAKALSTTTTKYTDASLIYYQQGLSDEEVKKRTDVTVKMANVAGESVETISDQLTAVWNNFDDGSKSLEYYADVMTALGAATASSVDEISGGLEKFAAIGDTIGLSFEYAASALATITSNTRQSEEVVGTALKTIFARIQGLKLGETQEDGTNLNKYSEALAKVGISIFEANGELKAMDNILDEMAAKWDELTKAEQAALAQTVAGIRQYTQLIALMENWNNGDNDSMTANLNTSYGSTGALQEQADIYAESWEAAQSRIKASLETLYNELIPTDFLISLTDAGSDILDGLSVIIDGFGGLSNILLLISNIALHKFAPSIITGLNSGFEKAQGLLRSFSTLKTRVAETGGVFTYLKTKLFEASTSSQELETHLNGITGDNIKTAADSLSYYDQHLKSASSSSLQMSQSLNQSALATEGLSEAFKLYLADTSQVYNLQALIEKNAKNLNAAEKERLSTMQQQLLVIANEKKELQTEISLLETQLKLRIQSATATDIYNAKGYKDRNFANVTGSKIPVKKEYDQALTLYSNTDKGYGDWIDPTIKVNKASFTSTSVDGIVNAGTKATQLYSNIETINAKINNILQQQGVSLKEQIAAAKQIVNTAETDKQINKEIQQTYIQQLEAVERSKSAQLDQNAAAEANQGIVQKLRLGLIQSGNEVRQIAQGFGVSDEQLKNVLADVIKIVSLQDQQAGKQAEWNSQLNNTKKTLIGTMDKFKSMGNSITSVAQGFSTLTMAYSMVSNAIKTLNDNTADFETKLTAVGFALPMLVQGIGTLGKTYQFLSNTVKLAVLEQSKKISLEKAEIIVNTLSNKIHSDKYRLQYLINLLQKRGMELDVAQIAAEKILTLIKQGELKLAAKELIIQTQLNIVKAKRLALLTLIVIAIAAVVKITKSLINFQNQEAESAKRAAEATEELKKQTDEARQALQNLTSAFDNYKNLVNALEECTEGTEEWNKALTDANNKIWELLETYPELAKLPNLFDENGLLNQDAINTYIADQQTKVSDLQAATLTAQARASKAQANVQTKNISEELIDFTEKNKGIAQVNTTLSTQQLMEDLTEAYANNLPAGEINQITEDYINQFSITNDKIKEELNSLVDTAKNAAQDMSEANNQMSNTGQLIGKDILGSAATQEQLDQFNNSYDTTGNNKYNEITSLNTAKTLSEDQIQEYWDIYQQAKGWDYELTFNPIVGDIGARNFQYKDEENKKQQIPVEEVAAVVSGVIAKNEAETNVRSDLLAQSDLTDIINEDVSTELLNTVLQRMDLEKEGKINNQDFLKDELNANQTAAEQEEILNQILEEVLMDDEEREELESSTIASTSASKYELDSNVIEEQAKQLQELYKTEGLTLTESTKLAVENQRMNQGVEELVDNWEDWNEELSAGQLDKSRKGTAEYAKTINDLTKTVAKLVGASEDLELPEDFFDSEKHLKLIEKAANGSEQAIEELGVEVGKATIGLMELANEAKSIDITLEGEEPFEITADRFENTKNTVLEGLNELQAKVAEGQNLMGQSLEDILASSSTSSAEWIDALNEMALATNMTVDQMNELLSSVGMEADVTIAEVKQTVHVPVYKVVQEHKKEDPPGTYTTRSIPMGTEPHEGIIQVAQIGTNTEAGQPKVKYIGNGSISATNKKAISEKTDDTRSENFDKLQEALEFKLKIDDSELEKLEYLLNKFSDEFYLLGESAEHLLETIDHRESILNIHENHITDLTAAYNAGQISAEDYNSGLNESKEAIYEQLNALLDLDKQMREYYGNTLDEADEELEDHTDHLEHLSKVFDHYVNLMDIFGKSKDYEAMDNFLQGRADIIKADLDTIETYYDGLIKEKDEVEKLLADAAARGDEEAKELYEIMLNDISDKIDETQDQMLEMTEEWAEAMKKVFENTFNKLSDELEKALTDGMGFDSMLNDFDLLNQQQEEFLTKTNQIYETNKLMRTATKAMDDTSNKAAKQKIKNYIEETKKLQNTTRLSKYELEIQQAKYDLLLAEIALEEAQNAKSTVRLTRDNEGNFGYVYTADQDEVDDAQQQLEDAQNNLYNIQYEGQQNALTKYIEALQDYYNAQTELQEQRADGTIASDEELKEKQALLEDRYFGPMGILTELSRLYNITLQENTNATAENLLNQYGFMTDGIEQHANLVQQFIGDMDVAWAEFQNALTLVHDEVQTALDNSEQATEDLKKEGEELAESIRNKVIPEIHKEIEQVRLATSAYGLQRDAIQSLINKYEDYIETLKEVATAEASVGGSNLGDQVPQSNLNEDPWKPPTNSTVGVLEKHGNEYFARTNDSKGQMTWFGTSYEEKKYNNELYYVSTSTGEVFKLAKDFKYDPWIKGYEYFNTGGYTGDWGPEGKLAVLHEKELVLNAADTSNILSAVSIIREIARDIDARASMSNLSLLTSAIGVNDTNQVLEQMVSIEASFPNATDRYEIEEAFNSLVNKAAQYANRK